MIILFYETVFDGNDLFQRDNRVLPVTNSEKEIVFNTKNGSLF